MIQKNLGKVDYADCLNAMQAFTAERTSETEDEIWFCEHPPVFTQGRHGKKEHILHQTDIPVIQTDRGGQVTYHGPGQVIMYFLIDLKRMSTGPKQLVCAIESAVIATLKDYQVRAERWPSRPGIYVQNAKIASLGLRIKQGKSYHGLSLNFDMDLTPFQYINPCGYQDLAMCMLKTLAPQAIKLDIEQQLFHHFNHYFFNEAIV